MCGGADTDRLVFGHERRSEWLAGPHMEAAGLGQRAGGNGKVFGGVIVT